MKQGTCFLVIPLASPILDDDFGPIVPPVRVAVDGTSLEIDLERGSVIRFSLQCPGLSRLDISTPKIITENSGMCVVCCTWDLLAIPPQFEADINGDRVASLVEPLADHEHLMIRLGGAVVNPVPSFEAPEAEALCKDWIDYRTNRLSDWEVLRKGRASRGQPEVVAKLREAIESLKDQLALIQAGRTHNLTNVIAQLRALIYWDELDPKNPKKMTSYTPLLYRVTAHHFLPLPVYAIAPEDEAHIPEIVNQATYRRIGLQASVFQTFRVQSLMDLQEAMGIVVQVELISTEGTQSTRRMTVKEILYDAAVTESAGHYDIGITPGLQSLKDWQKSALAKLICQLAKVVIDLGTYVLNKAALSSS